MSNILKNIEFEKVLELGSLVGYHEGQVVSRTLAQNEAVSITLFSFDAGEEISSHKSHGDAMVTIIEGEPLLQSERSSIRSRAARQYNAGGNPACCRGRRAL